jgi:hypothetical protein
MSLHDRMFGITPWKVASRLRRPQSVAEEIGLSLSTLIERLVGGNNDKIRIAAAHDPSLSAWVVNNLVQNLRVRTITKGLFEVFAVSVAVKAWFPRVWRCLRHSELSCVKHTDAAIHCRNLPCNIQMNPMRYKRLGR